MLAAARTVRTQAKHACDVTLIAPRLACATGRCSRLLLQAVRGIQNIRVASCDCSMCTLQPDARVVPHSAVLASETSAWLVCVQRARRVALGGKRKRLSVRAVCASQHVPLCACSLFLLELRDLTLLSLSPKSCGRELHSQLCPHIMVCMDARSMLPNTK